jgi:hypothetical protein
MILAISSSSASLCHVFDTQCSVLRLYNMGVIPTKKSLVLLEKLSTSSFCRRRLSVVMVRLRMAETLREACTFIEQVLHLRSALH